MEERNFISGERLVSCARPSGNVPNEALYLGVDWARRSDHTWFAIGNDQNDVIDWLKIPHVPYEEQVQIAKEWLGLDRGRWRYNERIVAARCDSTGGTGDAPNEMLRTATGLPMGDESFYQFTLQSKNALYLNFEAALFRNEGDPLRFSYPADHPLAAEFEEQMIGLVREYKGDGEYLSVHHPDEQGAVDDAPDCTALMAMASANGTIGGFFSVKGAGHGTGRHERRSKTGLPRRWIQVFA